MRIAFAPLLLALFAALGCSRPDPIVDRIDIREFGAWRDMVVTLNRQSEGRFQVGAPSPAAYGGAIAMTPEKFARLRHRLEPFRRQAVPTTWESMERMLSLDCPDGVSYTHDMGGLYIRWRGPGLDRHHYVDLGCDADRNALRNAVLWSVIESLHIPPAAPAVQSNQSAAP
jgi:hypothetical protein